ncbi:MAG: glycosyltransferase [Candidatus Krumholzibacteria bacterium]|nr:glycosyltransferase [Candidatus Krumholzibacteria bacterium]
MERLRVPGVGASLKSGIKKARGEIIVITDADGTHPPEEIPNLLSNINECDMVVGARSNSVGNLLRDRSRVRHF